MNLKLLCIRLTVLDSLNLQDHRAPFLALFSD